MIIIWQFLHLNGFREFRFIIQEIKKNWELYTHVLTDDKKVDLKKLPSAKGIWAPCLTYCEEEDLFYVIYGVMNSMNARYFDVDNFLT